MRELIQTPKEKMIQNILIHYQDSRYTSVSIMKGNILAFFCLFKNYKVLLVDPGETPEVEYDLVTESEDSVYDFINNEYNKNLKEIEKNGTDDQKKLFGFI